LADERRADIEMVTKRILPRLADAGEKMMRGRDLRRAMRDVSRVQSYGARFAGVVFSGETLNASIWKDNDKAAGCHHGAEP
jgi:hypothetical protein